MADRENWGSRIGLVFAAAGNAIGIGNLLRFPGQAANNGGGAFIIPYLVSLLLFAMPMMWIAWTVGRFGGMFGHGSTPGMFDRMWGHRAAKYVGVMGLAIPLIFCFYYTYIEAWCLGYAYFSATNRYATAHMPTFLNEFLGVQRSGNYFSGAHTAFTFLMITLVLNVWVLYRGVARGIELLAKVAIPLLFVFCVILTVRVMTLPPIKGTVLDGIAFLWNPDFSKLTDPGTWLAAAGQVFFTLSIGFGALECYASYVKKNDDIALTALTTAATNEFVEVIFGSLIAIPAAAVFFGPQMIQEIAGSGTFSIGMVSMPETLRAFGSIQVFGTIWFLLLFFAAFTSSVAVCQPVMAFFQDEAKLGRGAAAGLIGVFWILGSIPVVYFMRYGFLDELDFWAGTLGLVVFSAFEVILFAWIFKIDRGWEELHRGSLIRVPRIFYYITKYVTPVALLLILGGWVWNDVIIGQKLIPRPTVNVAVMNREDVHGEYVRSNPKSGTPEAEEAGAILAAGRAAVAKAGRDLELWMNVETTADGGVRVMDVNGDPAMLRAMPADRLGRLLELRNFHYAEDGVRRPARAQLIVEGLNNGPYIWIARVIMVALAVAFLLIVRVIWEARAAREGGAA